jgi:CHAD domain-containing protein
LKKELPGLFSQLQDEGKINALLKKIEPVEEPPEEIKSGLNQIDDLLNKAGYRIRFEPMNKIDPQLLLKELEMTYTTVVDVYIKCRNSPKPDNLHEFRKKSKDFLYQLYFFRPLNPSVVKTLEKKLDGMTQNLGRVNDLTQLVNVLEYKLSDSTNLPAMDEFIIKIREKQDRYLSKVWPIAYKIFCPGKKLVNILGFKLLVI